MTRLEWILVLSGPLGFLAGTVAWQLLVNG